MRSPSRRSAGILLPSSESAWRSLAQLLTALENGKAAGSIVNALRDQAKDIKTPETGRYLSVNDSYEQQWGAPVKSLMRQLRGLEGGRKSLNVRYVGSLVADVHRNLLGGGIFCYPANAKSPKGKLRLLYEANPLAFLVEQAGGAAIDGRKRIMEIVPTELHQRVALYIGSKDDVALATKVLAGSAELVGA